MTFEEMSNEEILNLFKVAIDDLPGGGAKARAWFHEVREEVLDRMAYSVFEPQPVDRPGKCVWCEKESEMKICNPCYDELLKREREQRE